MIILGKIKKLELTPEQNTALENGFRNGTSHCFRMWQFPDEDVYIASGRTARLNIFGMIDRQNNYKGFTTTDSITAEKVIEFLDALSFQVRKNTFVVLDNATVHRNHKIKELRPIWEKRGLFLFYLPPYSPHLNSAETLTAIRNSSTRSCGKGQLYTYAP